jgi:hypothetical protein
VSRRHLTVGLLWAALLEALFALVMLCTIAVAHLYDLI